MSQITASSSLVHCTSSLRSHDVQTPVKLNLPHSRRSPLYSLIPHHKHSTLAKITALKAKSQLKINASQTTSNAPTATSLPSWEEFATAASGEWDGVTATFDYDGEPQQLPQYYVPQAFRDWGVELYDWQSQNSMLVNDNGLSSSRRRLLPTVGCEADAIAFTEETSSSEPIQPTNPALFFDSDGSYSLIQGEFNDPKCFKVSVEHCLPAGIDTVKGKPLRFRAVHRFQRGRPEQPWRLFFVELHRERFDRAFDGKQELGGCGGGMDTFAKESPLDKESALVSSVVYGGSSSFLVSGLVLSSNGDVERVDTAKLQDWSVVKSEIKHKASVIGLPNAFSVVAVEGDEVYVAVGTVVGDCEEHGNADTKVLRVSTRKFAQGKTSSAELLRVEIAA